MPKPANMPSGVRNAGRPRSTDPRIGRIVFRVTKAEEAAITKAAHPLKPGDWSRMAALEAAGFDENKPNTRE